MDSSDFHLVKTDVGAWLLHTETHRLYALSGDFSDIYGGDDLGRNDQDALVQIDDDLRSLRFHPDLGARNRRRLASATALEGASLAVNVNLTSVCNLGCTYCFAEGGDYGRIKGKLDATEDPEAILAFIRANTTPGDTVRFEFFGGEPLLNFDTIETLCQRSVELEREAGLNVQYRVSTNLTTRMTERELGLFEHYGFTVSVSIDGSEATHDRNRPNKGGRGSFQTILENCRKVRQRSDAITLVARMTYVPRPDSSLMADIRSLHAYNLFDWFQVLPANVSKEMARSVFADELDLEDWGAVRTQLADKIDREYAQLDREYLDLFSPENRFRGLLEIETLVRMILNGEISNGHCSGGRRYFTFSPDKSIMPCHRLVGETEFRAATFGTDLSADVLKPWRQTVNDTPICADCSIRYLCGGGCKQENHTASGDINRPDAEKCRFQFRLVDTAIRAIAHGSPAYREQGRLRLRDLFVSCGRPILQPDNHANFGPELPLRHLTPVT